MVNSKNNSPPFKSISRRLIMYIVLCSSLVTLFLTIFQLQRDYETDIAEQDKALEQIRQVHLKTITQGLWATDTVLLQTIIEGLINIRDVNYAAIIDDKEILLSIGDKPIKDTGTKSFPLQYRYSGVVDEIGTLVIAIDGDAAFRRVLDRALIILISNTFKTALVITFTIIIFHLMVSRHLTNIIDYLAALNIPQSYAPLDLKRNREKIKSFDELDLVVNSINESSDRISKTFAMEQEIKEREYAEALLRKSEARLVQILDYSPFGVSIVSLKDRKQLYYNRRFTEMFAIPDDVTEIETVISESYLAPADRDEIWALFQKNGAIDGFEQQRIRTDKTIWWAYADWTPYVFAGEDAVMVWLSDVTKHRQAEEELKQLNEQKNKFFSIIAHDLKGPFNSLLGFSSLLSVKGSNIDPEKTVQYGIAVHNSATQVFKLLENLLDWSLLQMDRMEFEISPVSVEDIITENLDLFQPTAEEKSIRLKADCQKDIIVMADNYMLDTIIRNLILNAIKFTPLNGEVTITSRENGNWAEIEVSDTGVGIPSSKATRLFLLSEKTSTLGTSGETGTGLGLPLCKDLVERQGGQITVKSVKGKGSSFQIKLPLKPL
ncbi:ATP-binding protein [Kiloniella antarctica]|uniref:histidine kinase n=1 Tax=Kiloniella antarctica TaxID=1550907 RepID=A0ABW5BHH7_9PROT